MRNRFFHSIPVLPLLLALAGLPSHGQAQSLSLFDLDTRAYPVMRAKFLAFDADGALIDGLLPAEIRITENGESRPVLDVRCPPLTAPDPISAVLTLDVSGSMEGPHLALAHAAAEAWIDVFPFARSECALTTFHTRNTLQQDFTRDPAALRTALGRLVAGGGTSFDAALIDPFAGALRIALRGQYRRVVVLLTDGQADGSTEAILDAARQAQARIYCVTVDDRMPEVLRRVSEETGGRSYAGVKSRARARHIFRSILQLAQTVEPCVVEWESGGCSYARSVEMQIPQRALTASSAYSVTRAMLPDLTFAPGAVIEVPPVAPGTTGEASCTIRAAGLPVRIDAVTPEDERFTVIDYGGSPPPFTLSPGEARTLILRYRALDSARVVCRVALQTTACAEEFFLTAGFPGKRWDGRVITLLHPNGGEIFVAGADTVITWEGTSPDETVRLDFSADNGSSWTPITRGASGGSVSWRVPLVASDYCLVRVTLEEPLPVPDDMVFIPPGAYRRGDLTGTGTALERPTHDIRIARAFMMSTAPVTQRAFTDVMGFNPSPGTGGDDLPVTGVRWRDAVEYCNARSRLEGLEECYRFDGGTVFCDFQARGYRLPTEAEWEYACRAGSSDEYSGGGMREPYCDPADPVLDTLGWYCANAGGSVRRIAEKRPNAFGLNDMHGNVFEWCWDYLNVYQPGPLVDPAGPDAPAVRGYRVIRGGMHASYAAGCRSSAREGLDENGTGVIGFRVVRTY